MQLGFRYIDRKMDFDPDAAGDFIKSSQYYIQAAEKHPIGTVPTCSFFPYGFFIL